MLPSNPHWIDCEFLFTDVVEQQTRTDTRKLLDALLRVCHWGPLA